MNINIQGLLLSLSERFDCKTSLEMSPLHCTGEQGKKFREALHHLLAAWIAEYHVSCL
jgi:hypothetical protein